MSLNQVIIQGFIGNEPTIQTYKNNRDFVLLRIAQDDWVKAKDGSGKRQTSWLSAFLVGKLATSGSASLRKGDIVLLEGKLRQMPFIKDGKEETKLVLNVVHFERTYRPVKQTDSELSEQMDVEFDNYNK